MAAQKMKKSHVRILSRHWGETWHHYRHSKTLLPVDRLLLNYLMPGHTLAWNSLGARYSDHIPNLTIYESLMEIEPDIQKEFDNMLVLNVFELRYYTVTEIVEVLLSLCANLKPGGRLIFGYNLIFLHWNRIAITVDEITESLISAIINSCKMILKQSVIRPFRTDSTHGSSILFFEKIK